MTTAKTMRDVFIEGITERMKTDDRIFFVAADFGSPKLDSLRQEYGDRFINVGIAEQNLVNVAAGLALEGFTVYAYAIAPFLIMRAYEQIRNNLSLLSHSKEVNVNLVGVGAGLSYDVSGPTHHCLEDIAIMRTLPNITVFSPSDWKMAEKFVDYSIKNKKPKYLRFDGKPLPPIYDQVENQVFEKGFAELKHGDEVCLISTGYMTHQALKASELLAKERINIGVIDVFMLKPFSSEQLLRALQGYEYLFSLEEAFINKGGLDCLVAQLVSDGKLKAKLQRLGFGDAYVFEVGGRDYLHKLTGLDVENIANKIKAVLKKENKR